MARDREPVDPGDAMARVLQEWSDEAQVGEIVGLALAGITAEGDVLTEICGAVSLEDIRDAIDHLKARADAMG